MIKVEDVPTLPGLILDQGQSLGEQFTAPMLPMLLLL
jgi:hypothetical protein